MGGVLYFLSVRPRIFFQESSNPVASWLYQGYFFGFIALALLLLLWDYNRELVKSRKKLFLYAIFTIVFTAIPPLVLIIILPTYGIIFPSIYCEFAVLFAIAAYFAACAEGNVRDKKNKKILHDLTRQYNK